MTSDAGTPPKYNPAIVAQVILEEAVELHPQCLTADDLSRRVIADPDDHREFEAASQGIWNLKRAGLFCAESDDQRVVPTEAALLAFALLTR